MYRATDQFFSSAGLALDEHGEVGGRNSLEHPEDLAHRHAGADHTLEAFLLGRSDVDDLIFLGKDHLGPPHSEASLWTKKDLANPNLTDKSTVRGIEISKQDPHRSAHDLGVPARDGWIGEQHIEILPRPDPNHVELKFPGLPHVHSTHAPKPTSVEMQLMRLRRNGTGDLSHSPSLRHHGVLVTVRCWSHSPFKTEQRLDIQALC